MSFAERLGTLALVLVLAGAQVALANPAIQTWETPNGARVLFAASPELPMLDVHVVFDAGSARDGEHGGVASLTASMLSEGAGEHDADAFAERLEAVGAEFSAAAGRDMVEIGLRTLTREGPFETAIGALADVLAAPRFDADAFDRVRKNALVSLSRDEQDPGTVGKKAIYSAIFGDHPYASDPRGTPDSVASIRLEDVVAHFDRYYVARNAVVAMVGALTRDEAEAIATRITAGLEPGERPPAIPPVPDIAAASVQRIDHPSAQTHIYAGAPGMKRGDPDYFTLYVGNHILGGSGLVSLLMEEVREKRGLSYSVYSYFLPLAERGPFLMGLQTRNDQAVEAREVMMETLERFREAGPTDEELSAALKNITGGFPLRIASNSKIVGYLSVIGFYDLPLDYLDRFVDRVSAVTREDICDAFKRRVHPERMATVLVGPETES